MKVQSSRIPCFQQPQIEIYSINEAFVDLTPKGLYGTVISWKSSNTDLITETGMVNRLEYEKIIKFYKKRVKYFFCSVKSKYIFGQVNR
jgi:hypothetical protein